MTGIQLPGLSTGLDTTSLITALMNAASAPKVTLQNKVTVYNSKISSLQTLNNQISGLATLAQTDAQPAALQTFAVSSSAAGVTASAGAGAVAGSIDVSIDQLAQAQVSVTAAYTVWPNNPPTLTFVGSTGSQTEVTAASTNLDDVVAAINSSSAGVIAQKVAVGQDGSGSTQYRLQLSSVSTGASGAFQVYQGSAAAVSAGTAPDLLAQPGAATIKIAQDAQATLWAGTSAAQTVTSTSNTFSDLLPGVNVTATAVTSGPATLTMTQDTKAASATAAALVSQLQNIFQYIANAQAASSSTASSGTVTTTLGDFTADSNIRSINDQLMSAATDPVNGLSPSTIGINITKDGTVTFDSTKFVSALASDPTGTQSMFATIAGRIQTTATQISDPYTGTLTAEVTNTQSAVKDFNNQIDSWNTLLDARQAALQAQFAALETTVNQLNAQGSYLTAQINAMTPPTSKN